MPPKGLPRRRFLQTSATATGLLWVSFAGCTDFVGEGEEADRPGPDRDRPAYASYVPAEGVFSSEDTFQSTAIYVDFQALAQLDGFVGDGDFSPTDSLEETKPGDSAFFATPTVGLVAYALSMFGLIGYSFTDALMPSFDGSTDDETESTGLETDASVVTSFGYAFIGDYDVDVLAEKAESFSAVDSRAGFDIFEAGAGDDGDDYGFSMAEGLTFAASSEAVLVPFPETGDDVAATPDPERGHEMIDQMIDVVSGDTQNAADADADVDWMFRTAGHGAFGVGAFGDQDLTPDEEVADVTPSSGNGSTGESGTSGETVDNSEFIDQETAAAFDDIERIASEATAYASSVEPTGDSELVAHVALGYESAEDVPSESDVEAVFGDTTGEFSVETGERRIYLSSTYSL